MRLKDFSQMLERAPKHPLTRVAVAAAADEGVLEGVKLAVEARLIEPLLVGNETEIKKAAAEIRLPLAACELIAAPDAITSAATAVKLVSSGEADVVMKGMVGTAYLLKAVLNEEYGLLTGRLLSHVAAFAVPNFSRLLFMTDGGVNIAPDIGQKQVILQNAIDAVRALGYTNPKVAVLGAVETVNPQMDATIDAAILTKMAARGQIKGALVDGPLALDNAISSDAAEQKRINSPVAGDADLLLVPNIEAGNIFGKSLTFLAGGIMAGIVVGSKAPVILPSRADTAYSKFCSLIFASLVYQGRQAG